MEYEDREPSLPDHLKRLAQQVARHEMGHYVVARLMGFPTGDVALEIIGPFEGHSAQATITLTEALADTNAVESYLRARLRVLYAGAISETLRPHAPKQTVDVNAAVEIFNKDGSGAESDHAKARELSQILLNIHLAETEAADETTIERQLNGLVAEIWREAVELVEAHADTITGLACVLAERVKRPKERVVWDAASLEDVPSVQALAPRR